MKYLKYTGIQVLYFISSSLIIWGFNIIGIWGETFIDKFKWTYIDILIFVVCTNIAMSRITLDDFDK